MDVDSLLATLASKRPLFHSEADFQHALAWEIHEHYPDARIRLEYRPPIEGTRVYVDIWVVFGGGIIAAIELKYKTRSLALPHDGEVYQLLNQSAQDLGRYDFLKDVARLERLAAWNPLVRGVAILLTNDSSYWKPPRTATTIDAAFRLHEERSLSAGPLSWGSEASEGTMRSREAEIDLADGYTARWEDYSTLETSKNGLFRYLLASVGPDFGIQATRPP